MFDLVRLRTLIAQRAPAAFDAAGDILDAIRECPARIARVDGYQLRDCHTIACDGNPLPAGHPFWALWVLYQARLE